MIKSRDRKNSRTEVTTTNQPQISKQKHNCLLFCCRRRCIVVIVDLVSFDGSEGSRRGEGIGQKPCDFSATPPPQWQTTLTPTEKCANRKVLLFCNFQHRQWGCTTQAKPAVCWASESGRTMQKWNWHKSFLIVELNICETDRDNKPGQTRPGHGAGYTVGQRATSRANSEVLAMDVCCARDGSVTAGTNRMNI